MATEADLRKTALALPGVEEVQHWEYPAFRTKRRIFITLRPGQAKAMFHLNEEHQEILFEARPEAFEPLHWGKITRCFVNLKKVSKKELAALVREAWGNAGPPPGNPAKRDPVRRKVRAAGRRRSIVKDFQGMRMAPRCEADVSFRRREQNFRYRPNSASSIPQMSGLGR